MAKKMDDMIKINTTKRISFAKKLESKTVPTLLISKQAPIPKVAKSKERDYTDTYSNFQKTNTNNFRWKLWSVAGVSILFLFFALSYLFSRADVTINPKIQDLKLNSVLSATKDPTATTPSFDLVVISGEETQKVQATEKKYFEVKAKGTIIFYNKFSNKSQTLNIDTQLEGSNGKIYKTENRVVIPGMAKDGKPGSVEVGIYGANAGEAYNSIPLDFKILNFKNTPKYTKIYARSKDSISGGVKGDFYVISAEDRDKIVANLKETLQNKLLKKATEQIPSGFVLFKDAVVLNIVDNNKYSVSKETEVPLSFKGTLYGFLLDEKKLTDKLAKDNVDKYDGSNVYISNIKDLSFSLSDKENISFGDVNNISFALKGDAKFVWKFNTASFLKDLVGSQKNEFNTILSKYPNISSASLILKPMWLRSLPKKETEIKVMVNYPI